MEEERVKQLLPLATKIAREFNNIPGLPHAEIELAAQEALANAARLFDPAKGVITGTMFTTLICPPHFPPLPRKPVSSRFLLETCP
jgi:hypothetical protein